MDIAPFLDEAMAQLNETDRHALLLRFFEQRDLRQVGVALGSNEEAAKKRVTRAVEKLRALFVRRGVTLSAAGLAASLTTNAVQAARQRPSFMPSPRSSRRPAHPPQPSVLFKKP